MNRSAHRRPAVLAAVLFCLSVAAPPVGAAQAATTTSDPQIGFEDLEILAKPMTIEELTAEADAWQDLVHAKASAIARAEVQVGRLGRDASEASSDSVDADKQVKGQLVASLVALRAERTALIDRTRVILKSIERKGGEVDAYEKYLVAVSGLNVDVTDAGATWVTVTAWLMSTEGGIRWGLNLVKFVFIFVVFIFLARFSANMTTRAVRRASLSDLMRDFAVTAVKRTVLAVGFLMAVSMLEINVGPVLAILGAAGFVIAFALQDTLGNFASGIMILVYRPFDVGDVVDAAGVVGTVTSMNLVSTTLTTPDNKVVVVPNNSIWGSVITNVTGSSTRRVDLVFGIGYGDDIAKAQATIEEIVSSHPMVLADPAPVVRVHELADSSVNFVCRPWAKTGDYWDVYWDLTRSVKEAFDERGISIPFPQRDVHLIREG